MNVMNTTITISKQLKEKLDGVGTKKDSYNDIVTKLYEFYFENERMRFRSFICEKAEKYGKSNNEISNFHKKILKDVADGKSKSWDEVKHELLN
jgi:hypothetical protein